jgi:DNA-binding NarL/FixJ family response regulator
MGYWTKRAAFADVAAAVEQVLAGEPAFCPAVREYLEKG